MTRIITYLLFLLPSIVLAQEPTPNEEIKDTIKYEGKWIIRYMDYSWEYLQEELTEEELSENASQQTTAAVKNSIDTTKLFGWRWDNSKTFSRDIKLKYMKDTIELNLISPYNPQVNLPQTGKVTSRFGPRWGKMHKGIDLDITTGDNIHAAFGGKVRYARYNSGGYGYLIIIRHYNGLETYYAHLSDIKVKANQYVRAGDIIGKGGNTGHSTGSHLHFECRYLDNAFDPELIFDFTGRKLKRTKLQLYAAVFNNTSCADLKQESNTQPLTPKEQFAKESKEVRKPLTGNLKDKEE